MKSISCITLLTLVVTINSSELREQIRRRRQLYREQVLPHAGGKIPDSAFEVDRLALNKLQKEGIAIPDGILFEHREHQVYPYNQKTRRPTFLVKLKPSNRYTPSYGEYHDAQTSIETTYAIPQISGYKLSIPSKYPVDPVYKQTLEIPHPKFPEYSQPLLNNFYHPPPPLPYGGLQINPYTYGLQNNHQPLSSYWSGLQNNFLPAPLFNDFGSFYNDFSHIRTTRNLDIPTNVRKSVAIKTIAQH